jgi:hypothetical protein
MSNGGLFAYRDDQTSQYPVFCSTQNGVKFSVWKDSSDNIIMWNEGSGSYQIFANASGMTVCNSLSSGFTGPVLSSSYTIDCTDLAMPEVQNGVNYSLSYVNCIAPTPTNTNTPTVTPTQTNTPTNTITPTQTMTPTTTTTLTATNTPSVTPTNTMTPTNTRTQTPSVTPTKTSTPSVTPTKTSTPTQTATKTSTPTQTPTISVTPSVSSPSYRTYDVEQVSCNTLPTCGAFIQYRTLRIEKTSILPTLTTGFYYTFDSLPGLKFRNLGLGNSYTNISVGFPSQVRSGSNCSAVTCY